MNIVFLSPHFPPNYHPFCLQLRRMGASVLGIAEAPYDELRQEVRDTLTEYYRVDNMEDYDQILRACGYFTHIYGHIDRIESLNEYWIETEARLRTDFNVQGTKSHQVARMTRKSEMKKLFQKAGVPVARGKVVKNLESALKLTEEVGYPVVLKPNRGVGAAHTVLIENNADLSAFISEMPHTPYIMEEYIRGQLYSFDGLTDRDGNIVFQTAHIFSQGIMETVNEDRDLFYYSLRHIPEELEQAGTQSVRAFGIQERFFHIEFFHTDDNRYVGLEMNARPPGGLTTDMFNYANNLDIYEQWASVLLFNQFSASYSRPYHCGYVGRKLNKAYLHSHLDIMKKYGYLIVHHGPIESIFSQAIGNYAYLANSESVEELEALARFIQETG